MPHKTALMNQGIRAGAATSAIIFSFVYIVAAPTSYFRARIPFLVGSQSLGPILVVFAVFCVASGIGVMIARARDRQALHGALYPAIACTLVVCTGAGARLVPQVRESPLRWLLFGCVVAVSGLLLMREQRLSRSRAGVAQRALHDW